jgi:branched-subunit amino acid transport protein
MSTVWLILGMGAGVYALRLAGLALPDVAVPPAWEQALRFVPIALLTALVVSSLTGPAGGGTARLVAAAGAGLVARRTGKMWACILSGMALYWLLRLARIGG